MNVCQPMQLLKAPERGSLGVRVSEDRMEDYDPAFMLIRGHQWQFIPTPKHRVPTTPGAIWRCKVCKRTTTERDDHIDCQNVHS